jgi:hypothetical protein
MSRARVLALVVGLLVVVGYPAVRILARATDPASGALDLGDAWAWPPVGVAGLATSAAVYFWCLHRDAERGDRVSAVHETFAYHDAMLQSVVTARMALDLDEPVRAGQVLVGVIESASYVITSFVDPGADVIPAGTVREVV